MPGKQWNIDENIVFYALSSRTLKQRVRALAPGQTVSFSPASLLDGDPALHISPEDREAVFVLRRINAAEIPKEYGLLPEDLPEGDVPVLLWPEANRTEVEFALMSVNRDV